MGGIKDMDERLSHLVSRINDAYDTNKQAYAQRNGWDVSIINSLWSCCLLFNMTRAQAFTLILNVAMQSLIIVIYKTAKLHNRDILVKLSEEATSNRQAEWQAFHKRTITQATANYIHELTIFVTRDHPELLAEFLPLPDDYRRNTFSDN